MYKIAIITGILMMTVATSVNALPTLKVTLQGVDSDGFIEPQYAYCIPDNTGHSASGQNMSIGIEWTAGPATTKSYAIIAVDNDVPADFSNANKEGKTLSVSQVRRPFYHWILADIPVTVTSIAPGADSKSTAAKPVGETPYGVRAINDYSMGATIHGGYDGPCPPWNDLRMHHYHFTVYALNVDKISGAANMTGEQFIKAATPHIVAAGEAVGKYTLTPALMRKVSQAAQ